MNHHERRIRNRLEPIDRNRYTIQTRQRNSDGNLVPKLQKINRFRFMGWHRTTNNPDRYPHSSHREAQRRLRQYERNQL